MDRQRKTKDEFQLHANYGEGWEHEVSEDSRREILARQRECRENCPQYATKIKRARVRIVPEVES